MHYTNENHTVLIGIPFMIGPLCFMANCIHNLDSDDKMIFDNEEIIRHIT